LFLQPLELDSALLDYLRKNGLLRTGHQPVSVVGAMKMTPHV